MRYLIVILVAFGAYHWYTKTTEVKGYTGVSHEKLIMYSLTTCGFCKQKAKELRSSGIPYTEYFIDKNRQKQQELNDKLAKSGYPPKGYGMPIFDAYGRMLPNNPPVSKVISVKNGMLAREQP